MNKNKIIKISTEIANELGTPLYTDGHFGHNHYANLYEDDEFSIIYYLSTNSIYVSKNGRHLLSYNFNTENYYAENGHWPQLLKLIHLQIPLVKKIREMDKVIKEEKTEQLKALQPFLDTYVNSKEDENARLIMDTFLEKKGFSIDEKEENKENYYKSDTDYYYNIFYDDEKVLEYKSGSSDLDPFVDKYVPGEWTISFAECIEDATELNELMTNKIVNDEVQKIIKKPKH